MPLVLWGTKTPSDVRQPKGSDAEDPPEHRGAEEIIGTLREAEVGLAQGQTVAVVARKLGISEQTYCRWRREYGGMKVDQAKPLQELERENARLTAGRRPGPGQRDPA